MFRFIKKIVRIFFQFIGLIVFLLLFLGLLFTGIGAGGIWLLDYLISGEEVEVPRVVGLTKTDAVEMLLEEGLIPELPVKQVINEDTPAGVVVEQRPYPDTYVKKGRTVFLTVSAGPERIRIPDITGKRVEEIQGELRNVGLQIASRASVHHGSIPQGMVISQDPLPGRRIVIGKQMHVLLSLGPRQPEYVMPKLINKTLDDVMSMVDAQPFLVEEENIDFRVVADAEKWNRVLEQSPPAGGKVVEGEIIHLVVGSSGEELSPIRYVNVNFSLPEVYVDHDLFLAVWDDASLFNTYQRFPLSIKPWTEEIDVRIPVFGDAFVALMAEREDDPMPLVYPMVLKYYPSN